MGFALPVLAITGVVGAAYSGYEGYEAGQSEQDALHEQLLQVESQTKQQQINRLQDLNSTMASATAIGATQGYDLSSTSFNAPDLEDLNRYASDENGDLLSLSYRQQAIDQQISNAGAQGDASFMGGIVSGIHDGINLYGNSLFEHTNTSSMGAQMSQTQYMVNNPNLIPNNLGINYNQYRQSLYPSSYNPEL